MVDFYRDDKTVVLVSKKLEFEIEGSSTDKPSLTHKSKAYMNEKEINSGYKKMRNNRSLFIKCKQGIDIVAHTISEKQLNDNYSSIKNKYEIIEYSHAHNVLRNESRVEYGYELMNENILKDCLHIHYKDEDLRKVTILGKKQIDFIVKLTESECDKMVENLIDILAEKVILLAKGYLKNHKLLSFISFENFYDGEAIDLGVRIGLEDDEEEIDYLTADLDELEAKESEGETRYYERLLEIDEIRESAKILFSNLYYIQKEREKPIIVETLNKIANGIVDKINIKNVFDKEKISRDFRIYNYGQYD